MLKDSVKIKSMRKHKNALYLLKYSPFLYNNTKISWFMVCQRHTNYALYSGSLHVYYLSVRFKVLYNNKMKVSNKRTSGLLLVEHESCTAYFCVS